MSQEQPKNPLHGITLKAILEDLVARRGWADLASRIKIKCFSHEPSIKSSLTFLRKHPWARGQVERLYLDDHWEREEADRKAAQRERESPEEESEQDCTD